MSGIINAPWKLADDRATLLKGAFNDELLTEVLPTLVAGALPLIHRADRPMAVLDVLPARGKEARSDADDVINDPVMRAVSERQCIPTLGGGLRHPRRVKLHPEKLEPEILEIWASACVDPDEWTHHAVISPERRSKVVRLLGYHQRSAVSVREWVEHLVKEPTVEGSAAAVRIVARLSQTMPELRGELSRARVLLLEDGTLHACQRGQVFLPGGQQAPGRLIIDEVLAGDAAVVAALGSLGIEIFDQAGALRSELAENPIRWERVWASSRRNELADSAAIFRDVFGDNVLERIQVRSFSGKWRAPNQVFLPGTVVPEDGSRDRDFLVDPRFHQQDLELLKELGLHSGPRRLPNPPMEPWRAAQLMSARDAYRRETAQPRMLDESIDIDEGRVAWPLEPMKMLSDQGRAAMTDVLLREYEGDERWRISRRGGGGPKSGPDPVWSFIREHGRLDTQIGLQPVGRSLRWGEHAEIDGVEQPLPFVVRPLTDAQAGALNLKESEEDLRPNDWSALLDQANGWPEEQRFLLYAWAAYCGHPAPARIRARRGQGFFEAPPSQVAVTHRTEVFDSLVLAQIPVLLVTSVHDFDVLREQWQMPDGAEMLVETIEHEPDGEPFTLTDRFPPLRNSLDDEWHGLRVQPCKRLELLTSTPTGQQSKPLAQHMDEGTVYVTGQEDRLILLQIAQALDATFKPDVVLRRMEEMRRNRLRQDIAAEEDLLEKLLLAVGVEDLRASVPTAALASLRHSIGEPDDRAIAKLALAVDGYGILQAHVRSLMKKQLDPPATWAGQRPAREWVRRLGFPVEFAGFSGAKRAAELEVEGPPVLGDLHPYQRRIADKVKGLLAPDSELNRGLVNLPTGAGKTRVAVQALVDHMSETSGDVRILWLAETDELCEQAVQSWSQVWRASGAPGEPLTLSRLWGGNEANERDGKQVVVASLAKLNAVMERNNGNWQEEYGWLVDPTIIVVDEAHRSITAQYTQSLSQLGGANRVADMTTPLLGLTATPFRGFNETETARLAGRYHRNLLNEGVFPDDDDYAYLQDMGVLARVRHQELKGADLELTASEKAHTEQMHRLPDTVEQRLGQDEARNTAIVESVLALGEDETALLFATSVDNARALAALLTYRGVEARAVSGNTDPHARRRYIEDFKAKRVRVLTNYNVFTEGFDVPKVDAVIIARPTYSPNVYQQMIGRGLRGPLNGGKDEVLIVNVADNITNYGETLAFRHFEHLWK
ncbi:MAG TPA: DEAD/DEAH box helicase [Brevibacterium sp.]|nr:DEAD/DEAH box helicase [Brevibacterium sp.]